MCGVEIMDVIGNSKQKFKGEPILINSIYNFFKYKKFYVEGGFQKGQGVSWLLLTPLSLHPYVNV